MRPLPTSPQHPNRDRRPGEPTPDPTEKTFDFGSGETSPNRRSGACPTQRAYPWLLGASTLMAAAFCWLYLSKPVIVQQSAAIEAPLAAAPPAPPIPDAPSERPEPTTSDVLSTSALPGDIPQGHPRAAEPQALAKEEGSPFEETNLRIQHALGAQGPAGEDLGRIILEVPVLYQSGSIRWSTEDVAQARSLLTRIGDYQAKSRALRDEAVALISEWDALIVSSIPEPVLRADSPTLPENQGSGTAEAAPLKSTEAIEIEEP